MKDESQQNSLNCQLTGLSRIHESLSTFESTWQLRNRLKRIAKRRLRYALNWLSKSKEEQNAPSASAAYVTVEALQVGDLVQVRSREQIQGTLDRWNWLKGCDVMEEMWPYCGTTQRVLKRVENLDERDYRVKRCKGIVLLEEVRCEGTVDYGSCDRCCYYFWREEWLEKIG